MSPLFSIRYGAYKNSGEGWLGEVPSHWHVVRLKSLFREKKHRSNMALPCGAISFGEVVHKNDEMIPELTKKSYQEVLSGEFLVNPLNLNYDLASLRIALSEIDVVVSAGYIILQASALIDRKYFKYLLHCYDVAYMKLLGSGVRQTISFGHISSSLLLCPPLKEQSAISRFLGIKCAQIDQAIQIKERQIELLKERKQLLIQQAVTQGLDPRAPMRYSGVDWIGDVPAHWVIKKIRYLGTTQNGISAGAEFFGHGHPFVSYGDVYNNEELPEFVSGLANASAADRSQYSIERGDVLFTRTSETAEEIGFASTCFKTITNATFAGFLIRFRPKINILFEGYSKYYFNAPMLRAYFVKEMSIVTRASLSQQLLKNMPVLFPPAEEQREIYDFLERETAKFKMAIEIQIQQIGTLKEYKATLINSAVTGKIKVPEIVESPMQNMELA
ncbi:restriction endonuclease subunit S [Pseudomonas sp. 910_23]|uniref:restriction endonuclease subunit S n=1 Tax=Pseudomonas sp. 910_23 TaxID=2604461 RepID=UPI0040643661